MAGWYVCGSIYGKVYISFSRTSLATCLDAPKSASLMQPLLSTRMLAPWTQKQNKTKNIYWARGEITRHQTRNYKGNTSVSIWPRKSNTFMSLCMIPFRWRYSSPCNSCLVYILITCSTGKITLARFGISLPSNHYNEGNHIQPPEKIQTSQVKMKWIRLGQTLEKYLKCHPLWLFPNIAVILE